jgi:hypothetical protein
MNVFFACVATIRSWWQWNFRTTEYEVAATAFGRKNLSRFSSAVPSAPALMIQPLTNRTTADTGTGAALDANKSKPSIVRVIRTIRVRRRRPAGETRFPGASLAGGKAAHS